MYRQLELVALRELDNKLVRKTTIPDERIMPEIPVENITLYNTHIQ